MSRVGAVIVLVLGATAAGTVCAQAQQVQTLWNCKDPAGRTIITSQKADTVGKECRVVSEERVSVVPANRTKSPANFPKESSTDRVAAKARQKETLEKELSQEEAMLADARKKLAEQEAIRTGDERNYAKVIERLKPYKDTVEVHEKNVEALKRELTSLSR
jgi:hypothetical protein